MRASAAVPIHVVEQHDVAYTVWRNAGVRRRVLLHIDAHHDLYGRWFDKKHPGRTARINIANFIYAAIADELVREIIWVVPDATLANRAGRRDVVRELRKIVQKPATAKPAIHAGKDKISGTALGCPIHVCTLDHLPDYGPEPLLLDIDIDYLVIPNVGLRGIKDYGSLPWIWPSELVTRLEARGVITDLVTIACSVEGGYTPLQWKYFADELKQRLGHDSNDCDWAACLRRGAESAIAGDFATAEVAYQKAAALQPTSGAPRFHLANLCAASGRIPEAQEYLREAQSIDPSYRTPFSTAGLWYLGCGRYPRARDAFDRALSLDPHDCYACLGLGMTALAQKDWADAEYWFRRSLALDETVDANRGLARVLTHSRDNPGAIAAYEQSIRLALLGRRSVTDQLGIGAVDQRSPIDSAHGEVHAELAWLYAATGNWTKAIAAFRMAIAMNAGSPRACLRLAGLYARARRAKDAMGALAETAAVAPKYLHRWGVAQRIRWKLRLRAWSDRGNREKPEPRQPQLWGGM